MSFPPPLSPPPSSFPSPSLIFISLDLPPTPETPETRKHGADGQGAARAFAHSKIEFPGWPFMESCNVAADRDDDDGHQALRGGVRAPGGVAKNNLPANV